MKTTKTVLEYLQEIHTKVHEEPAPIENPILTQQLRDKDEFIAKLQAELNRKTTELEDLVRSLRNFEARVYGASTGLIKSPEEAAALADEPEEDEDFDGDEDFDDE